MSCPWSISSKHTEKKLKDFPSAYRNQEWFNKSWELLSIIKHPSGQLNENLTLVFMLRCKYYKKITIWGNISLVIALGTIYSSHISLNSIVTFLRRFYSGDLENFAGSAIIFFFIAALTIQSFSHIVALPRWIWLLLFLRYFFLGNCSREFPQHFFAILWVIVTVKRITVKVK